MRIFLSIILFYYFGCLPQLTAQIKFKGKSYSSIMGKAHKSGKLIFVDCYTTWCGPCKWMDKNIYNDKQVGDYYNNNFINWKLDMESEAGLHIAQKYNVTGYPTFLYLDSNGKVLHKEYGARELDEFLQLGVDAIESNSQIRYFESKYEQEKYDPDFMYAYARALKKAKLPNSKKIADEYLSTQVDWSTPQNIFFIYEFLSFDMKDIKYQYVLNHIDEFSAVIGQDKVENRIVDIITGNLGPFADPDEFELMIYNAFKNRRVQYADQVRLERLAMGEGEISKQKFLALALDFYQTYLEIDPILLNNLAWNIMERTEDSSELAVAVKMVEESIHHDPEYYNYDSLAHLLFKLGKIEEAKASAIKAVEYANASGENYKSTQELIWKIRKALGD